jgi:hypothetical protein
LSVTIAACIIAALSALSVAITLIEASRLEKQILALEKAVVRLNSMAERRLLKELRQQPKATSMVEGAAQAAVRPPPSSLVLLLALNVTDIDMRRPRLILVRAAKRANSRPVAEWAQKRP